MFDDLSDQDLLQWIETSLKESSNNLASGYQGQTLKYLSSQHSLVIKIPHGRGLLKKFNVAMLKHENNAYKKLMEFNAVPICYGMIDQQYMVLQYINAKPIRHARPANSELYFKRLFEFIETMHERGVAHFDLKKKDNLLVLGDDMPCIIDFGAAVIKKPGFHPINHFLFNLARQFDYNAWIKHKYNNKLSEVQSEDRPYYKKTNIELIAHKIKRFYKDHIFDKRK